MCDQADMDQNAITFPCEECGQSVTFPRSRCGQLEVCPHCHAYVDVPTEPTGRLPSKGRAKGAETKSEDRTEGQRTTSRLWLEVVAVLCLAVIPDMYAAILEAIGWTSVDDQFAYAEFWYVIRSAQVSLPLLVILSLTGEPWGRFGIVRFSWAIDVPTGMLVWMCGLLGYGIVFSLLPQSVSTDVCSTDGAGAAGFLGTFLILASGVTNGFAEELVMRGYLLTRLEQLLHSTWVAVLVTTVLFASYHIYQGPSGVASAAAVGLLHGTVFAIQRRLWPICIAHAVTNIVATMPY